MKHLFILLCYLIKAPHTVLAFCAPAKDVLRFAMINRIGRNEDGSLHGFQRATGGEPHPGNPPLLG